MTVYPYVTNTNWKQFNLIFINDDTLEGEIKMYDCAAIKGKRLHELEKKTKKTKKRFTTKPYMEEVADFRKTLPQRASPPPAASGDNTVDLDNSLSEIKNPRLPGFGYPMMNFKENPLEKVQNRTVVLNTLTELGEVEAEIRDYE